MLCISVVLSNLIALQAETEKSVNLFLYIDLPRFDFPVVFTEPVSLRRKSSTHLNTLPQEAPAFSAPTPGLPNTPHPQALPTVSSTITSDPHLWSIVDPDMA